MNLEKLQENWDKLGQDDAMWAVLTDPEKKGRKWTPEEFFKTGESHIAGVLKGLAADGIQVNFGCALDFGCGVGRLSQALAARFNEVHGVDIAPSMVEQANSFNRFPGKCHYHVNGSNDLKRFPDQKFDFICTFIVFQHIQQPFVLEYIREFVRSLRPGGIAIFHFVEPSLRRRLIPRWMIDTYRSIRRKGEAFVWEFGVARAAVDNVLASAGAKVLRRTHVPAADRPGWSDYTYVISK